MFDIFIMEAPGNNIAGQHLVCNIILCELAREIMFNGPHAIISTRYSECINTVLWVAEQQGYDVMSALYEKLDYNKHRLDHKPEARAAEGGKKF